MLKQGLDGRPRVPNAHFLAASAQALPFSKSSFDVLLCTVAFHHFPDPKLALREFRRILSPGGKVIIVERCRDLSLGTWMWDRLHRWFQDGHVKYYRRDELTDLLADAGFDQIRVSLLCPSYATTKKLSGKVGIFSALGPS
jgi:ubiquinone/menaquinone biosynthesis C-methylase UbiE